MKKIAYELVSLQVDKLYDFSIKDANKIDEQCLLIEQFIESCGWNMDDYIRTMLFSNKDILN